MRVKVGEVENPSKRLSGRGLGAPALRVPMTSNAPQQKRVFVTRMIAEPALERLRAAAEVEVWPDEMPPPHSDLVARLNEIDGVLSMVSDRLDAETIAGAPRLLVISNLAVGVDN